MLSNEEDLDKKITTGNVAMIAIPSFLTLLVLILLGYLTIIVSDFNHSQTLSACRGRVSQEIQEQFRTDVSNLIALAGRAADGPAQREQQQDLLDKMVKRPNYVDEVKRQCGQDLKLVTSSLTTTTMAKHIPEE